ncbi:hypothetical protein MMC14_004565 [Varicellaria rhodocarpa]|nr:hypothetical protein [Varicellaria rhodocarpa]
MKFTLPSMLLLVAVATAAPLALKSAVSDIDDLAVRGDSAPVMTDSSGEIVPFNTDGVVTTRDESNLIDRGDSAPVMTTTSGVVVPFNTAGVVTAE